MVSERPGYSYPVVFTMVMLSYPLIGPQHDGEKHLYSLTLKSNKTPWTERTCLKGNVKGHESAVSFSGSSGHTDQRSYYGQVTWTTNLK